MSSTSELSDSGGKRIPIMQKENGEAKTEAEFGRRFPGCVWCGCRRFLQSIGNRADFLHITMTLLGGRMPAAG